MLDDDKLKTPSGDGEVLLLPHPREWVGLLNANGAALRASDVPVAGRPLGEWRQETRMTFVGDPDRSIIVLGHQPEFIHPGVWAKHVVAQRLARATGGVAVNLIVDNDTPRSAALAVPSVQNGHVRLQQVPVLDRPARRLYEELAPLSPDRRAAIHDEIRRAMDVRFDSSLMPGFLRALAEAPAGRDAVSQLVTARRFVERELGIEIDEYRVSEMGWSPLLIEMSRNAARFAECYNTALAAYRAVRRIRGTERPMPDLRSGGLGIELPVWAVRRGDVRRRVFVSLHARRAALHAEDQCIGVFDLDDHAGWKALIAPLDESGGWRLRLRALTLTLWARLFLADIFIHGIGGAKYDRICDELIRGYFHQTPPEFLCVSATLRLDLPGMRPLDLPAPTGHHLRDWRWNPQRHLSGPHLEPLLRARHAAVAEAEELRTRGAPRAERRRAFGAIRQSTDAILEQAHDQFRMFRSQAARRGPHPRRARVLFRTVRSSGAASVDGRPSRRGRISGIVKLRAAGLAPRDRSWDRKIVAQPCWRTEVYMTEQTTPGGLHIDSDWKTEAALDKERLASQEPVKGSAPPSAESANFIELVNLIAMQAAIALGGYQGPGGERIPANPIAAKHHIDLLEVLEKKTAGNLSEDEKRVLDGVLYELRMHYVSSVSAPRTGVPKA